MLCQAPDARRLAAHDLRAATAYLASRGLFAFDDDAMLTWGLITILAMPAAASRCTAALRDFLEDITIANSLLTLGRDETPPIITSVIELTRVSRFLRRRRHPSARSVECAGLSFEHGATKFADDWLRRRPPSSLRAARDWRLRF